MNTLPTLHTQLAKIRDAKITAQAKNDTVNYRKLLRHEENLINEINASVKLQNKPELIALNNVIFFNADMLQGFLKDADTLYRNIGLEMNHELRNAFNTAVEALKYICDNTMELPEERQCAFGDAADALKELNILYLDRVGDHGENEHRILQFLRKLPSMQHMNLKLFGIN